MNTCINETARPAWEQLPVTIQAEWKKSLEDFYPEGAIPKEELDGAAKYDYELAETLHPAPVAAGD